MLVPLLFVLVVAPRAAGADDEIAVREARRLSPEQCLALTDENLAVRCPTIAGRRLDVGSSHLALLDRLDQKKGTFLCDQQGSTWRCRRIVVLDRDLRSAKKRNPDVFVTAAELLSTLATGATVKLGDEFGALFAPGERPRSCTELPSHGCAVESLRLRGRAADAKGTPIVRRRMWLVEDADGTTLECSDAELHRCDELTAAGWTLIALTLRPSSLAPPAPAPEHDLPQVRSDKRKDNQTVLAAADAADTPAGALDPWLRPKLERALPRVPSKADVARVAHEVESRGKSCIAEATRLSIELLFSGEGNLISLTSDDAAHDPQRQSCLLSLARKINYPRFAGNVFRLRAVVVRQ